MTPQKGLNKVCELLETDFGWGNVNYLTEMQLELVNDVIAAVILLEQARVIKCEGDERKRLLLAFELYYHEEYGENIIMGAMDEFIKHISKQ
jgi:hypothetical protein